MLSLQVRVNEIAKYVMEYLADRKIYLLDLGIDEEDVVSIVELIVFCSLHY